MKAKKMKICRFGLMTILFFCLSIMISLCVRDNRFALASGDDIYKNIYVGNVVSAEEYQLSYNGNTIKAEGLTVLRPSGGVYGGKGFVAEQAGVYEVTYYATVNGNRIEEKCNYKAIRQPKDIIHSTDATVSYGKYEVESPYQATKNISGAIVSFKAGSSITFGANIKTEKLTADYNIFDLIVMPSVFKETDFERLTVQVMDSENPSNYVEVIIDSSNTVDGEGQVSYVKAGAAGQQAGGYEGSTYHTAYYGTQVEHSFRALGHKGEFRDNYTLSESSITVAIDHASRKVYCGPANNETTSKLLVNDLDDEAHYKGNPWNGFTSEEVVVKITASSFSKTVGNVVIKSFGDYNFAKQDIEDKVAPQINLQYSENEELPVATVGMNFPIIPFTVKDALDAEVNTNVYVYYLADNGQRINVSTNGYSFFAKYAGEYEIVYCAEDYSGNKTTKSIIINAYERAPEIFIAIDEAEITSDVYKTVSIKQAADMQAFGGNGNLSVERFVYSPTKKLLDVKDSLQLTELGDYKVVYKVTDYLNNEQYGIVTIHSTELAKPSFVEVPTFDKKLIKGFVYNVPQPFVVETKDGNVLNVASKAYVNGQSVGNSFTASGDSVEIKYVAEGKTGTSEWTQVIPVEDTERGKYQSKYFHAEGNATITDEKDYLQLSIADNSMVSFVKEIYSKGFSFTMSYDPNLMNFSTMAVVLTDAVNRDLSVTLQFFYDKASNAWFMQLNRKGGKISYATSKNILSFTRGSDGVSILDTSGVAITKIQQYDNGEAFKGFSNTLYLSFEFGGVKETSAIYLTHLCNQLMGYKKSSIEKAKDEIDPVILLNEEFQLRQKLGTEARIPLATACDVLGQISEFTVKVEMVGGSVLASGDATKPIKVLLNEAGNYLVSYYAKDTNGNDISIQYMMLVNDETAPTLTVNSSLKETYKVGSKVSIPSYSAKDNGKNCYVQVTLILPNNEMRLLQYSENGEITSLLSKDNDLYNKSFKADDNTFIVEQKGKYVLRFVAYDEYYNYVEQEFVFNVN